MNPLYRAYEGMWRPLFARLVGGVNVFDREWDALVLLDCCRIDFLRSISGEFPWIERVDAVRSVGSQSKEWIAKTFVPDHRAASLRQRSTLVQVRR